MTKLLINQLGRAALSALFGIAVLFAGTATVPAEMPQKAKGKLIWLEEGKNGAFFRIFESAPASELLDKQDYVRYQAFLGDFQCLQAAHVLNKAFIKRYPQFAWTHVGRHGFSDWLRNYISSQFPELEHCIGKAKMAAAELDAVTFGDKIGRFRDIADSEEFPHSNNYWRQRDTALSDIIMLAVQDHPRLLQPYPILSCAATFSNSALKSNITPSNAPAS